MTLHNLCYRWLILPSVGLFLCVQAAAQTAPDADLYYRRTHDGAAPPPGTKLSDHSGETTNIISADSVQFPKSPQVPQPKGLLDNGVDPANLGKGDWIWQMPSCETALGVSTVQGVIDWEKSHGMQWITVKCGDGASIWTQFNTDLITRAHTAGMKIFGWAYAYGSDVTGEINVAINALNLGADGFIIDAETEYETLANNNVAAAQYCQGIRAAYPTRFLAHAPFPVISAHSGFPYKTFGTNCDAVMPQDYWADIGGTSYAVTMVTRMNTEWRNWQAGLTGVFTNAIKPIAPIGQGYNSVNGNVDGTQIATFVNALKTNTPPATAGGFKGVSWWSCQHHGVAPDKWPAIGAVTIGSASDPAYLLSQPVLSRAVDAGGSVSFSASAGGATPISYQWCLSGVSIPGATNSAYTLANAQATNSGSYTIVVTNLNGGATSAPVSLTVHPPQTVVFSDSFDTDTSGNWTVSKSSTDTRITFSYDYSASGIASAPHSVGGTTRGVKFEANLTAGVVAALSMAPVGQIFSGDYRVHFDMWINANGPFPSGGTGSTEFFTAGIGTAGNRVQWTGTSTTADGYWFSVDGDGGVGATATTSGDYCAYIGTALQNTNTGIYTAGTNANPRDNLNNYYLTAFPTGLSAPVLQRTTYAQQTGSLNAGTVGFAWHDVIVSKRGTTVEWSIDGVKLATVSNATFTANNVFVGYWDNFVSISDNTNLSFGLVDNLRVEVPAVAPGITAQPQDRAVAQGANATFNVTASGTPAPGYQWTFNGTNIDGATGSSYTRLNAQPADAGDYAVVITNAAGSLTSSNALLTVHVPPTISAQPQSQTVNQGSNATFAVTASGTPVPGYQWTFSGTNIGGATGSSYTRLNAQLADAGTYAVVVTNAGGSLTSSNALLAVNVPPTITAQPQSQTVTEGSNVTFTVTANGTPTPGYQWTFNGTNLTGATSSSYTHLNAQPADAGSYAVVVTNTAGSLTSSNALLTVYVPPTISAQPQSQTVIQGSNATFTATASGSPAPGYQWTFNGTNIAGAVGSSYARVGAQPADAGSYAVIVTNAAGSITSSNALLAVNVPPSISAQPQNQTVNQGSNATFTVTASGTPAPGYQWAFNGTNIAGAVGSSYTRMNAQLTDAGSYAVVVTNAAGSVTSSDAVLSVSSPQPPRFSLISVLPDQHLDLVLSGQDGSVYLLEASSNLLDWSFLATLTNTNGTAEFIADPPTNAQCFYRARLSP